MDGVRVGLHDLVGNCDGIPVGPGDGSRVGGFEEEGPPVGVAVGVALLLG